MGEELRLWRGLGVTGLGPWGAVSTVQAATATASNGEVTVTATGEGVLAVQREGMHFNVIFSDKTQPVTVTLTARAGATLVKPSSGSSSELPFEYEVGYTLNDGEDSAIGMVRKVVVKISDKSLKIGLGPQRSAKSIVTVIPARYASELTFHATTKPGSTGNAAVRSVLGDKPGEVSLTVEGVSMSTSYNDIIVQALLGDGGNKVDCGSLTSTVIVPWTMSQLVVNGIVLRNNFVKAEDENRCYRYMSLVYDGTIQVKDQFGDNLGPIYEGARVVEDVVGRGVAELKALSGGGQTIDPVGFGVSFENAVECNSPEADEWRNAEPGPVTMLIAIGWAANANDHFQIITVDGHDVSPPYRRRVEILEIDPVIKTLITINSVGDPVDNYTK